MEAKQEKKDFIFRSKLPDIDIPNHLPLHEYCFQNISKFNTRTCMIDSATGVTYMYSEVELTARKVAAGLNNHGIKKGDVIMLLLPNSPDFVFAFLGASYRGAIATTANPYCTPQEIVKQIKASNSVLIITKECYAYKVKHYVEVNKHVKIMCTDNSEQSHDFLRFSDLTRANECEKFTVDFSPDDVMALPYSSGTTGFPKGVMLTHKVLVTNVAQQVDGENPNLYFHADDVIMCVLPLFHIYAMNSVLLCALRVGASLVIMDKFDVMNVMEMVERYKVTVAPFVPTIFLNMVKCPVVGKYDLSSVRSVLSGSAPMGKELEDTIRSLVPNAKLGQGYGMTEAGPVISMSMALAKEPSSIKSGSCGTVVRNAEMKIVDPETGKSVSYNQVGEICIRGDQVMKGYLNDTESTERTIDKEGWLHTGDVGYVDEDEEMFIVDRIKELIKYKGFQVAPAELEALLIVHPNISDAAVVAMKDETAGEVPVAFIVRANGSNIQDDDIKKYISEQVVYYKRISRVFFVDAIPKSFSGKILRKQLRAKLTTEIAV